PYAGLVLRGIPQVWVERMFGDDRSCILLSGVDVGSPAWRAGFRGGDLIEAVDGGRVPPLAELARSIEQRGEAGGSIALRVRRGDDDRHEAAIELADYRATREVWVPLLFRVRDGYYQNRWSVGPFGLLCNREHHWLAEGHTRAPQQKSEFNALFGL